MSGLGDRPGWSEDLLSAYVDGECTEAERAEVEARVGAEPELRSVLDELAATRAAVRALPERDAPPGFWARLLESGNADERDDAVVDAAGTSNASSPAGDGGVVVPLAPRRERRPVRWLVAIGAAAAAAVVAAAFLVPQPKQVTPPVAAFTQAHALRSSIQGDAVSSLAPVALGAGFRR